MSSNGKDKERDEVPFMTFVSTKAEGIAYEKVHSYRRGWTDGAAGHPEDQAFIAHETRRDLTGEYRRGYHDGGDARIHAMNKACRRLKYDAEKAVLR